MACRDHAGTDECDTCSAVSGVVSHENLRLQAIRPIMHPAMVQTPRGSPDAGSQATRNPMCVVELSAALPMRAAMR